MSRRTIVASLAAIAATGIIAGCGSGTKQADPYAGFSSHPAAMHKWCADYNDLLNTSGWTDNQIYNQLQDTGTVAELSRTTFKAQVRWCYNH